ncbi:hypothetical protein ACFQ1M_06305 [Sungkyunkwania multivorans]|uniref:DUF4149 domain-containing protein n=1 Tax=Sungkyunkwania multivorans TaxID=1173618 RepID=A0ABW3CY87_9FLAO
MTKKETYWLLGSTLLAFALFFAPSGFSDFDLSSTTDINVYDTYYILPRFALFVFVLTFIFFVVYLIRMLSQKFKNIIANLIFISASSILILIFTTLIAIVHSIRAIPSKLENSSLNSEIIENGGNAWNTTYYVLLAIQLLLIILLVISAVKTGKNYKYLK